MTTITPIYVQPQPKTQSKHKVQAQVGNVATGALGVGAVYGGVKGVAAISKGKAFKIFAENVSDKVGTLAEKVAKRAANKATAGVEPIITKSLFPKHVQILNNIAKEFKCDARNAVGKYMIIPAAILTVAGIVGKTIFNAGKISAE